MSRSCRHEKVIQVILKEAPIRNSVRNCVLLILSMSITFTVLRLFLHWSPNTDLNLGQYNIHHLFTGLILIVIGGIPLAIFRSTSGIMDLSLVVFGVGLGMALDEWVYLIVTDGTNQSYLLPVSFWGGLVAVLVSIIYAIVLVLFRITQGQGQL